MEPAIALLELESIAVGIAAGDAMAKRAPIEVILAGTVHPGKYLVLVGGTVGDVEEALDAGREAGAGAILDSVFLPNAHPDVVAAMRGRRREAAGEALGIIETPTVAAVVDAADAGVKGAHVRLLELRLADDLGGKGYLLFDGPLAEVEAAVEIGSARIAGLTGVVARVIARLHPEMGQNLEADARFGTRIRTGSEPDAGPAGEAGRAPARGDATTAADDRTPRSGAEGGPGRPRGARAGRPRSGRPRTGEGS